MKQINWLNLFLTIGLILSITILSASIPRKALLNIQNLMKWSGKSGLELNEHKVYFDNKNALKYLNGPSSKERTYIIDLNHMKFTEDGGIEYTLVLKAKKKLSMHYLRINEKNESNFEGVYLIRK